MSDLSAVPVRAVLDQLRIDPQDALAALEAPWAVVPCFAFDEARLRCAMASRAAR